MTAVFISGSMLWSDMGVTLSYKDIRFIETDDSVQARFYRIFSFDIPKADLARIGKYEVSDGEILFPDAKERFVWNKFGKVLERGFRQLRRGSKPAVYVHMNSGIPLYGSGSFGIVDRGTTLIEIKPITGCNLDCIYCSVDEEKRSADFVVEKDYLVAGIKDLIRFKAQDNIEVHIGTQGEPLLYSPLVGLIRDIRNIDDVGVISMDTNATMLTSAKADELLDAGLTRFNVSLNALDPAIAERMAGTAYDLEKVKSICRYLMKKDAVLIAPLMVPGINEGEMEKIVRFAGSTRVGIQNFLNYRFGRNPAKQMDMEQFFSFLQSLQEKTGKKLILDESDFGIRKSVSLPLPFRKGEMVTAEVVCQGRMPGEMLAVAKERCITVRGAEKKGKVKVRITRTKHNIFYGSAG